MSLQHLGKSVIFLGCGWRVAVSYKMKLKLLGKLLHKMACATIALDIFNFHYK